MPSDHRVGYSHELLKITAAIQPYQNISITAIVCFSVWSTKIESFVIFRGKFKKREEATKLQWYAIETPASTPAAIL